MTTTKAEILDIFDCLLRIWGDLGVDTTNIYFTQGSVTYGRSSQIVRRDPVTGSQSTLVFLPPSRNEAANEMLAMIASLHLVRVHSVTSS